MYFIYSATNKINNKKYIGKTKNIIRRKSQHKYLSKYGSNTHFHKAIRHHGFENFKWDILYESKDEDFVLNIMEPYFIKIYDTKENGYNLTQGGGNFDCHTEESKLKIGSKHKGKKLSDATKQKLREANLGKKMSEEAKQKIRETLKGRKPWNTGKPLSEEHKNKIANAGKGRKLSEEHKKILRESNLGRKISKEISEKAVNTRRKNGKKWHTEESRRKIGLASKGRIISENQKKKISKFNKGFATIKNIITNQTLRIRVDDRNLYSKNIWFGSKSNKFKKEI